jgi:hypothetical protein
MQSSTSIADDHNAQLPACQTGPAWRAVKPCSTTVADQHKDPLGPIGAASSDGASRQRSAGSPPPQLQHNAARAGERLSTCSRHGMPEPQNGRAVTGRATKIINGCGAPCQAVPAPPKSRFAANGINADTSRIVACSLEGAAQLFVG